mgnify:CR=1 FL=1
MRCFARDGFASSSMADIISESGMSAGSIYSHFESKTDLIRFVASTVLEPRLAAFPSARDAVEILTPAEAFLAISEAFQDRERARVLIQVWGEVARDPEMAAVARENFDRVRNALHDGLGAWAASRSTSAERAADVVIALLQGYVTRVGIDALVDPSELRRSLADGLH